MLTLIDEARVETQNHETMTMESVTWVVSNLALQFGKDADLRIMSCPFGVALCFGGVRSDEKGLQLFHVDPSETFVEFDAQAIGSASEGAKISLQDI